MKKEEEGVDFGLQIQQQQPQWNSISFSLFSICGELRFELKGLDFGHVDEF